MSFNFDNFAKTVHHKFNDESTLDQVKNILSLEDGYSRDSPISTGKRLTIDKLTFTGRKPNENEDFSFTHNFKGGINLLIASNLKGKSSVFKIIKFALTGKKPDNVIKWLKEILLDFSINDISYAVYIDVTKHMMIGKLMMGKIDSFSLAVEHDSIWETKGSESYVSKINDFFFNQFSYYNLKWTQKSSQKDSNDLNESNASWATYFSSIYLESKDSYTLTFGAQETKIFEMLMGLELTYPINRLKIRLDKLQNEQAQTLGKSNVQLIEQLEDLYKQKQQEYHALIEKQRKPKAVIDSSALYAEYDRLASALNKENNRIQIAQEAIVSLTKKESALCIEVDNLYDSLKKIRKEKDAKEKKIIELNEYLNSKFFFSNLDIHHCPNCNHTVSHDKKEQQLESHTCLLCSEPLSENEVISSKDNIQNKISEIQVLLPQFSKRIEEIRLELDRKKTELDSCRRQINLIDLTPSFDLDLVKDNIKNAEQQINELHSNIQPIITNEEEVALIKEIGNIEGQLLSLRPKISNEDINFGLQNGVLELAIKELKCQRHQISLSLISKLRTLMLSEIERFGLRNISEIAISEDMSIKYTQHGETKKFDDFVEGEQLRLKIAFYLSLIQLDVNENYGRHTRFLIIDSPTKEEADDEYLGGFVSELEDINTALGDKIQILIGTANRSFENKFQNQLIIPQGQFVF